MPDHLSYNDVLAILQDTGRITGTMASFPTTNDTLLRMDCAIRFHLSQTAARIQLNVKKYNTIFEEYERVRAFVEQKGLTPQEFPMYM
jgi:hypothetical protein